MLTNFTETVVLSAAGLFFFAILVFTAKSVVKSVKAYHPDRLKTDPEATADLEKEINDSMSTEC